MADDRLFIVCKGCGGWKMLLKHMVATGLTSRDNGILEWLNGHIDCHGSRYNQDLAGNTCFTLQTESQNYPELCSDKQNYIPAKPEEVAPHG